MLARVNEELRRIGDLKGEPRTKACCALVAHPTLGRYVKTYKKVQPKLDPAKARAEEKLDGKYLLSTSDDTISAEDAALGYKQLHEVEDAFWTLKTTLSLRPVYHRVEDRIRTHVLLCWLSLLLVRVASLRTGRTWAELRRVLERMHVGEFGSKDGSVKRLSVGACRVLCQSVGRVDTCDETSRSRGRILGVYRQLAGMAGTGSIIYHVEVRPDRKEGVL